VRKSQLANYEGFRAMYEGRNAKLFHPTTGVLTWMSNPAQPSFVWQLYHHDLEPNSALFAVKKAAEPIHIQLNEASGEVQVINNLDAPLTGARAHLAIYNLDGSVQYQHDFDVTALASAATTLGPVSWPANLSAVHFVKLELRDATGKLVSDNFYWRGLPEQQDDLKALGGLPTITLDAKVTRSDVGGMSHLSVTLHNSGAQVALMAHLQLRRKKSGERVLPVYYSDNYVSLLPNESKEITIEVPTSDLKGDEALVVVDGWNVGVNAASSAGIGIAPNTESRVDHWPVTGLPIVTN
jgi:Exo-beta-D-glucosaminidase Ig-fold domain